LGPFEGVVSRNIAVVDDGLGAIWLPGAAPPTISQGVHSKTPPTPDILDALLALNAAHEIETSPLEAEALRAMINAAFFWAAPGDGRQGMIIAFDQDAAYTGTNFKWFQARFKQFIYVDRIIIAPERRGQGLAGRLYGDLIAVMREQGHSVLTCEINISPPNPGSLALHQLSGLAFGLNGQGYASVSTSSAISKEKRVHCRIWAASSAGTRFRFASASDRVWPQNTSVFPFSNSATIRQ
jgi:predicted GNAT superfamily acetyltransferase